MMRRRKSAAHRTNTVMLNSWNTMPATMVLVPGCVSPPGVLEAEEAKPPPAACTTSEMMSQVQKIQR